MFSSWGTVVLARAERPCIPLSIRAASRETLSCARGGMECLKDHPGCHRLLGWLSENYLEVKIVTAWREEKNIRRLAITRSCRGELGLEAAGVRARRGVMRQQAEGS